MLVQYLKYYITHLIHCYREMGVPYTQILHCKVFSIWHFENLISGLFFRNYKLTATAASFDSVPEATVSLTLSFGLGSFPWRILCMKYGSGVQQF